MAYYQLQLQAFQQQVETYTQLITANPQATATLTMATPPPSPPMNTTIPQPQTQAVTQKSLPPP